MRLSRLAALGLLASTLPAFSDVMYTYTGPNFNTVYGSYTTSDHISGSLTLANPLAPNTIVSMIPLVSFSFTDGHQTISDTTPGLHQVEDDFKTNASGAITAADIIVNFSNTPQIILYGMSFGIQSTITSTPYGEAYSSNGVPGTWTGPAATVHDANAPEPSSFALLATGLAGAAGVIRRRIL